MTEQERQMIVALADRMRSAPAPAIDRDANALIQSMIGARPDALYVLTQTVLIQDMALKQAQARSQENFLPAQPQAQAPAPPQGGYASSRYAGQQQAPPPPPQEVVYEEAPRRSGFSDFLHNAAQTAAGVIAGEVAFDALSSIFGHRGYGGGGFFSGGGIVPGGETVVNNYYGDQGGGGESRFGEQAASSGDNMSPDIEDDRDRSGQNFMDDGSGNDGSNDDGSSDDGSSDDFSGGDDSGGDSGGDSGF